MTTRKDKLEKALADLPKRQFTLRGDPLNESSWKWEVNPPPCAFWDDGLYINVDEMNHRLAPLHAALIEAVEALEKQADCDDDGAGGYYTDAAQEALSKIDKVLGEG